MVVDRNNMIHNQKGEYAGGIATRLSGADDLEVVEGPTLADLPGMRGDYTLTNGWPIDSPLHREDYRLPVRPPSGEESLAMAEYCADVMTGSDNPHGFVTVDRVTGQLLCANPDTGRVMVVDLRHIDYTNGGEMFGQPGLRSWLAADDRASGMKARFVDIVETGGDVIAMFRRRSKDDSRLHVAGVLGTDPFIHDPEEGVVDPVSSGNETLDRRLEQAANRLNHPDPDDLRVFDAADGELADALPTASRRDLDDLRERYVATACREWDYAYGSSDPDEYPYPGWRDMVEERFHARLAAHDVIVDDGRR